MIRLIVPCLLGISVCLCWGNVSAQDAPTPVIRQAPLDAVYISGAEGHNIVMHGWSPTQLDNLYKSLFNDQQDPVPPFFLRNVSAAGKVVDHYVEVDVQIELLTSTYQPIQVPLGFREGILPGEEQTGKPTFRYTGPGSALLTVDAEERQYVAIVVPQTQSAIVESEEPEEFEKPGINQQHTLSLLLWLPLTQNSGGENHLVLSFPQSNSSLLSLEVPMENITASVTRGWIFEEQNNVDRQSTLLKIQGLRTDTEIVWRKKKTEIVDDRPVLLVEGASIDVRLDASTATAVYDAVLPVSSATGSFDQLQIRLPQGSMLDREFTDRYAVSNDYSVGDPSEESIVTIQLYQKTTGPLSLRLKAVQQFEGDKSDLKRELSGFEVLGAERQAGSLTVSVLPLEMKPHWELVQGVRRPEESNPNIVSPMTSTVLPTGVSRFDLISQPFLLYVRAATQPTRINVKPDYLFRISKELLTMTARFTYTVSGNKTDVLYLRLSDSQWWGRDFGMSSIVDTASVDWEDEGLLKIPLLSPRDGTFEIEFRAYRFIPIADEQVHRIILPIPEPQVSWSEPAGVTIAPENNVEVVPIDESFSETAEQRTSGLTLQSRRAVPNRPVDLADLRQEPRYYRTEPVGAVFVADLIYHQQKVSAAMRTDVRLFEDDSQVTQTVSYDAVYAPVERLYFLLPKSLASGSDIQVTWDNSVLELRDAIPNIQEDIPENFVWKSVQLPEPMYKFQLTFQYSPPPLVIAPEGTAPFSLSFIYPSRVSVSDHRVHFFAPSGYKVELQNESRPFWESFREPRRSSAGAAGTFRSVPSQSSTKITLFISAADRSVSGTTLVERAWLQTWLTSALRVDRATYLLKSANDSVPLQLPPDAVREHPVFVRIDGQQILPNISPTGMLTLPITLEQQNRPVEVVVDYRYPLVISGFEVSLILPTFAKEISMQYQIWEVILTQQSKHIIGCPAGWTQEYNWAWNGLFWWRVPSIRQSDLGFDADPTDTESAVSKGNQYVFSHLQPPPHATFYIVNRSLIVLCSSGIALLIGLVLIYVPQARYVGSLFGLGITLLAVLLYQPPLALLILQAAVFGVFLALGTGYVYRIFHRQQQWIPPAFQSFDEISQPYTTPVPVSQTVHEVVMDESTNKDAVEPPAANNGQS